MKLMLSGNARRDDASEYCSNVGNLLEITVSLDSILNHYTHHLGLFAVDVNVTKYGNAILFKIPQ